MSNRNKEIIKILFDAFPSVLSLTHRYRHSCTKNWDYDKLTARDAAFFQSRKKFYKFRKEILLLTTGGDFVEPAFPLHEEIASAFEVFDDLDSPTLEAMKSHLLNLLDNIDPVTRTVSITPAHQAEIETLLDVKQVGIRLSVDLTKDLDSVAASRGITRQDLIRDVLRKERPLRNKINNSFHL